jgi:cell division protein FtsI/penicillin-binding protein 2
MLNRALSSPYEIGALSQLITTVGALSEGTVHSWDMMTDSGTFSLGNTALICPLYEAQGHTHGTVSIATAMREGCTAVFGPLGAQLGNYRYSLWESALGLGQATGIELAESAGTNAGIYPGVDAQVAAAAAGQISAKATPAQLCTLLCTVLRGGDRPAGHLLLEIRDFTSGEAVYRKPSESLSYREIRADHVSLLTQAMRTNANLTSALSDAVMTARGRGMALGSLSSATSGNALALVLATPMEGVDSVTDATISVSAVLEGATAKDDAARVAAQALADYLSGTNP